jgi:cation diffusion facilitator family transporter
MRKRNMTENQRVRIIKNAAWISILGNSLLAILKLGAGVFAGSLSVLGDGIDSTGDVLMSIMTLFIATIIARPPNLKFPYGYAKAETNATNALAFIIFFAGAQLAISSVRKLVSGEVEELPGKLALIVVSISIIGKLLLAWHQYRLGKKVKSKMLIANAKNMQADVFISVAVLAGLISTYIFQLPILDPIAAFIVSIWIIWISIRIFLETNVELMDGNVGKDVYEEVFHIVESVSGVENPHRMRIRKIGHKNMINIDIEVNGDISVSDAHQIAHNVENKIKNEIDDVFDVAIHVEPYGDHIDEKEIGISKKSLENH